MEPARNNKACYIHIKHFYMKAHALCMLIHAYIWDINVETNNDDGLTALQLAELNGDYDIVESFKKMELK